MKQISFFTETYFMKGLLLFLAIAALLSCNSKTSTVIELPAKPASVDAAAKTVKGKSYETKKVAIVSIFEMDKENPYEWMNDMDDTTKHFRDYLKDRMSFSLRFVNDTSVILNEEGKETNATYKFDTETGEDEKEGVKLRISYPDDSMSFPGIDGPMIMTYSFLVAGADERSFLLETPRSYNKRKIAVLMQAK